MALATRTPILTQPTQRTRPIRPIPAQAVALVAVLVMAPVMVLAMAPVTVPVAARFLAMVPVPVMALVKEEERAATLQLIPLAPPHLLPVKPVTFRLPVPAMPCSAPSYASRKSRPATLKRWPITSRKNPTSTACSKATNSSWMKRKSRLLASFPKLLHFFRRRARHLSKFP